MGIQGATKDYSQGPKCHWRRTVWNEVLSRTQGRQKRQAVLYLPGPDDLDRKVAVQKGVPDQNLVAVDLHGPNVDRIRAAGHPAIRGDVWEVLWAWPDDKPIAAVVLDFCGGLERDTVIETLRCFGRRPLRRAVIAINMLRGRDPSSNILRELIDEAQISGSVTATYKRPGSDRIVQQVDGRSRGLQLVMAQMLQLDLIFTTSPASTPAERRQRLRGYLGLCLPRFLSYRSGRLVYDTVIMDAIFGAMMREGDATRNAMLEQVLDQITDMEAARFRKPRVVRRLAAALAVRTMRQQGTLPTPSSTIGGLHG